MILNYVFLKMDINQRYLYRGIKQGCPLSALLFILAAEIMAIEIRNSNSIEGIKFENNNKQIKKAQLADDTTLFLKSEQDILNAINLVEIFGKCSGLQLVIKKTEAMWIGRSKSRTDKVGNIT
jgi:hypothetical protein